MNLATHLPEYLAHLEASDCTRSTVYAVKSRVQMFFRWLDGSGRPLDRAALFAFRDLRMANGRRPRTLRADFLYLRQYLEFLAERGHLAPDAVPDVRSIKLPRKDAPQRYAVTDQQLAGLFNAASRLPRSLYAREFGRARAGAVLAALAFCGVRRQELFNLDLSDLLHRNNRWFLRVRQGKAGQYREVPLSPEAWEAFERWLAARKVWAAREDKEGRPLKGGAVNALFPADRGSRLADNGLTSLFRELKAIAGLDEQPITPHCLRGWFITRAAAAMDIVTAAKLAGHSSVNTTIEHYLKTDQSRMEQAADAIPALLADAQPPQQTPVVMPSQVNTSGVWSYVGTQVVMPQPEPAPPAGSPWKEQPRVQKPAASARLRRREGPRPLAQRNSGRSLPPPLA